MTSIALMSAKHSPGVTTLALALACTTSRTQPSLVVEADPAGGDLAARLGLPAEPGLITLAAAGRHGLASTTAGAHVQGCSGGFGVLVAPPSAEQATAAIDRLGPRLLDGLDTEGLVVIDLGRWSPRSVATPLFGSADHVVIVLHPTVEGVVHTQSLVAALPPTTSSVCVAVVGRSPYLPAEVEQALAPLPVQAIEVDRVAASRIGLVPAENRWLRHSLLVRCANSLVSSLVQSSNKPPAQPARGPARRWPRSAQLVRTQEVRP